MPDVAGHSSAVDTGTVAHLSSGRARGRTFSGLRAMSAGWGLLLVAAIVLYALFGLFQIDLPGLYYDEALDAVPALQVLHHQPLDIEATVSVGGRPWPLMVMSYVGTTTTYLLLPVFGLFGGTVAALRIANWAVGLLALLLAWGFLRDFLDERVAGLATLLLAVSPTFVFWARLGAFVSLPMLPLSIAALWSLWRWYRRGSAGYLALAAFCLGLGLSTKLLFLWLWVALGLCWLLLSPGLSPETGLRRWLWPLSRLSRRAALVTAVALALGGLMLILYNALSAGMLRLLLDNARHTELYGVNNLDLPNNLRAVLLTDFRTLLDGSWFNHLFGERHRNLLAVPAFLAALAILAVLARRRALAYSPRRVLMLLILLGAILFQSAFTITSLGATHLMILWPIPQALVAVAGFSCLDLARPARTRHAARFVLAGLAAMLVLAEVATTGLYHRALARTGGYGIASDAMYTLANDLASTGETRPVALDWGFRRSLQFLSQGQINPEEGFTYTQEPGEAFAGYIDARVVATPTLYLLHSPARAVFNGHRELFEAAAYRHRLQPVLWNEYRQRDGEPVYDVYRLEPLQHLFHAPPLAHPLNARLGDDLALLGYQASTAGGLPGASQAASDGVQPGGDWQAMLYWQATARPGQSYKVFVHLSNAEGVTIAQHDGVPQYWGYPTDQWQPGEVVPDPIRLKIPGDAAPGTYRVVAGMYDEKTGRRLPISLDGQPPAGDTVDLATITIRD